MLHVPKVPQAPQARPATAAPTADPSVDAVKQELQSALGGGDPMVLKLTRPIKTHHGDQRELRLREPNAGDYIAIGRVPWEVRGDGEDRRAMVDFKIAGQWASRLTNLDDILIGQLSAPDWLALVARVNALLVSAGIENVGN